MPEAFLSGSPLSARSQLDELRERVVRNRFQDPWDLREFIDRYVSENPEEAQGRSDRVVDSLVSNIRAELGLSFEDPGSVQVIPEHVRDLILGYAAVSQDTSRWAIHHGASEVAMFSGQFVYEATHVFIDGAGMDFAFHCTYKSQGFHS